MGNSESGEQVNIEHDGKLITVDLRNAVEMYRICYGDIRNREICLAYIEKNFLKLFRKVSIELHGEEFDPTVSIDDLKLARKNNLKQWKKLPRQALIQILKSDRLAIEDEFELLLLVRDWAVYRVQIHIRSLINAETKRLKLENVNQTTPTESQSAINLRGSDALYHNIKEGVSKMLESSASTTNPASRSSDDEGENENTLTKSSKDKDKGKDKEDVISENDSIDDSDEEQDEKYVIDSSEYDSAWWKKYDEKKKNLLDNLAKTNHLDILRLSVNYEYKILSLKLEMKPLMKYIRFPMMGSDSLQDFVLHPELEGFISKKYLYEALRHHAMVYFIADQSDISLNNIWSGPNSWYQIDKSNRRFQKRNYHTRFSWDRSWKGQHIAIEEGGKVVKRTQSEWFSIAFGDMGFKSGVHFWEIKVNSKDCHIGVSLQTSSGLDNYLGAQATGWAYVCTGHKKNSAFTPYGSAFGKGDKIGVRLDVTRGRISFYKNGVSQGVAFHNLPKNGLIFPAIGFRDGSNILLRGYVHGNSDKSSSSETGS